MKFCIKYNLCAGLMPTNNFGFLSATFELVCLCYVLPGA